MKQTLEQAAEAYSKPFCEVSECGENYTCTPQDAFKAGAEWQKKQMCKDCPNRGNTHAYLQGLEDGKDELTPEDIGVIFSLVLELEIKYNATEGCYSEVLDRFKKYKEEKK